MTSLLDLYFYGVSRFIGEIKKYFKKGGSLLPSFNMGQCTTYFTALNPSKTFCIPSWILKFASPQAPFKLDPPPPTYQEITNVIRKMKPSGSPCPLDRLSVICFKRSPYFRSYLTRIVRAAWSSGAVPLEWTKVRTILIHKKERQTTPLLCMLSQE